MDVRSIPGLAVKGKPARDPRANAYGNFALLLSLNYSAVLAPATGLPFPYGPGNGPGGRPPPEAGASVYAEFPAAGTSACMGLAICHGHRRRAGCTCLDRSPSAAAPVMRTLVL